MFLVPVIRALGRGEGGGALKKLLKDKILSIVYYEII